MSVSDSEAGQLFRTGQAKRTVTFNPVVSVTVGGLDRDLGSVSPKVTASTTASFDEERSGTYFLEKGNSNQTEMRHVIGNEKPAENTPSFIELQKLLNKLTLDLQEEENRFTEAAGKVNARDKCLMVNAEKITKLQSTMDQIRAKNKCIENALGFLRTQQNDLEGALQEVEACLPKVDENIEVDRAHLVELTSTVDAQLTEMATDLQHVIEHINAVNNSKMQMQQNDPLLQISKILSEHTDALQWVEEACRGVAIKLHNAQQNKNVDASSLLMPFW